MKPNHRLRMERQSRGWSQGRLAKQVGTTARNVSRWEHGVSLPYPYFRERLCALFGKEAHELGLLPEIGEDDHAAQDSGSASLPAPVQDLTIPYLLVRSAGLIGRDDLLAQLKQRLFASRNVVSTALHGLPGIGKTALAVSLLADSEIQNRFHDGILWAGLGPNPDVAGLLAHWGNLLGVSSAQMPDLSHPEAWTQVLRAAIGKRRMLLVIDDAWTAEEALAFQVGGPACMHLVTTRHPRVAFACAGEAPIQVSELNDSDGLRLLARFVPDLVAQDPQTTMRLVRQVGGLPLALTLIGKFLGSQAYNGQPRRLQRALAQMHEAEQRLQVSVPVSPVERPPSLPAEIPLSLLAVIAVSDQHLSDQARRALRALAVFPAKPNSFAEEAALAVAGVAVEVLDELMDAGILESHSPGRYTLHQTLADYGRSYQEGPDVMQRLIDYYVNYLHLHQMDMAAIEQESHNIRVALQEALARDQLDSLRGLYGTAPTLSASNSHLPGYLSLLSQEPEERDPFGIAMAASFLGSEAWKHGYYQQAETALSQAVEIARHLGHSRLVPFCYGLLVIVERSLGDYRRAAYYLDECLQLAQQLGFEDETSAAYAVACLLAQEQGDYARAEVCGLEGVRIARQNNNPFLLFVASAYLGLLRFVQGHDEQAHILYLEALEQARSCALTEETTHALVYLSQQAYTLGDYQQSERYAQEGLVLARQHGYSENLSLLLLTLGLLCLAQGQTPQAEVYLLEGLDLARQITNPLLASRLLIGWSMLQRELGQLDGAEQALREALAVVPAVVPEVRASCQYQLACVAAVRGNLLEARILASSSARTLEAIGHRDASIVQQALQTWSQPETPILS